MPAHSVAFPRPHPTVGAQLVRRWEPEGATVANVVLVHGIAEHTGRYERVGAQLASAAMAVTAADLVGCGATGGRRGDIEDWALYLGQVEELVVEAAAGGRPVVLLGHSMGGLIALEYALSERHPPDLLVLSAPGLSGGARWQRLLAPLAGRLTPTIPVPNRVTGDQLSRDPEVGAAYFADPLVLSKSTARLGAQLFAAMDRTRAAIGALTIPTLVLHGGRDRIVPPSWTVELGDLPGVERRLFPPLRHELFNEPEGAEIVDGVIKWIEGRIHS